jgi:outer membrane protein assembly factor BamE
MPAFAHRSARWGFALLIAAGLAACGSFDGASTRLASVVTPYKVDVVQGNFVSREQVEALQAGMGRQQVRDILGTPLVSSLFHADRWEYVFTLKRPGVDAQTRKLTVFFKGDALERFEGDEMPSESEFVASLDSRKGKRAVPVLEATPEQLAKFPARAPTKVDEAPVAPAPANRYPPLESSVR